MSKGFLFSVDLLKHFSSTVSFMTDAKYYFSTVHEPGSLMAESGMRVESQARVSKHT